MNQKNYSSSLLFLFVVLLSVGISCSSKKESAAAESKDPKIINLKLPAGFHADHLYGPSENGEGSWVSMTFDDKGRIIASDQYGAMYRLKVPAIGDTSKTTIERINIYDNPAAADTGCRAESSRPPPPAIPCRRPAKRRRDGNSLLLTT